MAQNLPDEVLKEILSLSTHIPDEEFSFNDDPNPFGQNPRHFSLLLLVCKRWLRVATPLLYGVVVIRSTAQAQSLADAVQANKSFGSFIKKMRLEGGFGQSPRTFLSLAPNISDLFITLDIWTNDSVSGLCSALQQIEPCRLIISQRHSIKNAKARKLRDALYAAVAHWKHLDTVEYYNELWIMMDDDDDYEDDSTDEYRKFTEALTSRKSLTLKNLILPDCTPRFMAAISQITTLESVRILHGTETENMKTFLMNHPKLATIVHYPSHTRVNPHAPITSSLLRTEPSSNAKPFRGAPATMSDTLWGLIFSYATSFYEPLSNGHNIPMEKKRRVATAISISSVCRSFHEIMQPRLYRIVLIRNPKSLKLFSELVSVNKDVGPLVLISFSQC
ncbi:hypothetical protein BD410DRAFT_48915 [Rickenella mellea]|uniref:Uncharacterized protein n=1 Tax=Rickenella mellea TaxID=50990 RepID=A0A4R5XGR5_9AGAM|nr:hypothetical protein BD410DRAFT_48915 [Rickenella mellea]